MGIEVVAVMVNRDGVVESFWELEFMANEGEA